MMMKMTYLMKNLLVMVVISVLSPSSSASSKYGVFSSDNSATDNLLRNLDRNNNRLRNSLMIDRSSTMNEVDDYDYFMDEKEVQRAWARSKLKKHEEQMRVISMQRAMKNVDWVLKTAQCSEPTKRCLDVNKMEFGKPKSYWPNCALVHKCSHDSGCCSNPKHTCSPVKTETIELYFFAIDQTSEKGNGRVELLTFENHTLCDCRPRDPILFPVKPIDCLCPKHFSPVTSSLECRCDCDMKQSRPCRRVKKGKRSYHFKGCKGKCGFPNCDFGAFKKDFGRCPRKNERNRIKN